MDKITIKDIAKICGVGVSTVSRAINNEAGINEETKNKILQAIREYNYIPNNSARNLKRQVSRTIAISFIVILSISQSHFQLLKSRCFSKNISNYFQFYLS